MKLKEKQYFQLKVQGSLKWSSTVFGIVNIVIGSFVLFLSVSRRSVIPALFLFGAFFLTVGILILAIRKWELSLAGTIGVLLILVVALYFSVQSFQEFSQIRQNYDETQQAYLQAIEQEQEQEQEKTETVSSTSASNSGSTSSFVSGTPEITYRIENLEYQMEEYEEKADDAFDDGLQLVVCAVVSLGAAILGCKATSDLNKCHKMYLLELEKELGESA